MDYHLPRRSHRALQRVGGLIAAGIIGAVREPPLHRTLGQTCRLIAGAALVVTFIVIPLQLCRGEGRLPKGRTSFRLAFFVRAASTSKFMAWNLESGIWNAALPPLAHEFWYLESGISNATLLPGATDSHSLSTPRSRGKEPNSREPPYHLIVHSNIAAVVDADTFQLLYEKNPNKVTPIASITKLMTAIVTLDAKLPLAEVVGVSDEDVDDLKGTRSFLPVGSRLTREDMLHIALMASENRAAACLSRYYPGGRLAFIEAMNRKARELGMDNTHFVSPNGLSAENVSTALDLVRLVKAACEYPLIRQFTTDTEYDVFVGNTGTRRLQYVNTDRLVGRPDWEIELQKTGYITESGRCLVMEAQVDGRHLIMVFLNAYGKLTCFADARRVRRQLAALQRGR